MTKSEAIKQVLMDNGGLANLQMIYSEIEKYYPNIKDPKDWEAALRGIIYRDIENKKIKRIENSVFTLIDFNEENLAFKDKETEEILRTTKDIQATIRIGQSKFRKLLLENLKKCPITGISDKRLLLASHIKPWAFSDNNERIDPNNGFLFSPLFDKMFDCGLITFEFNKKMIFSPSLKKDDVIKLSLEEKIYNNLPIDGRENYLEFHRNKIFLQV